MYACMHVCSVNCAPSDEDARNMHAKRFLYA